ncbi:MAG: NifU family protein [Phycisphaerales bacterium]|nr:NifU family protein [Phycisphaerales bacterium]
MVDRIEKVIELMRPAIQADGGDVELVEARADGTVLVRFHGACVGCPSSDITLQLGIEKNLRQHVPEVQQVCVVD